MSCNNCLIRHGARQDGNTEKEAGQAAGRQALVRPSVSQTASRPQKHLLARLVGPGRKDDMRIKDCFDFAVPSCK